MALAPVKHVTGFPRNARDGYFPRHSVTRPAATTAADLPPIDAERESLPADAGPSPMRTGSLSKRRT